MEITAEGMKKCFPVTLELKAPSNFTHRETYTGEKMMDVLDICAMENWKLIQEAIDTSVEVCGNGRFLKLPQCPPYYCKNFESHDRDYVVHFRIYVRPNFRTDETNFIFDMVQEIADPQEN